LKIFEKISDGLSNLLLPMSNETLKVVVLCFVTATTFWFFNALNDSYTTRINYPVTFIYNDTSYVAVEELPDNVKINVSGGGWNLLRRTFWFTIEPLKINLVNPERERFMLGASLYTTLAEQMNEIQLNFVETDTIWFAVDSIVEKSAGIFFDSAGVSLAVDYKITSAIRLSDDSATFRGPKRFIQNIPDSIILKADKERITKDYEEELLLSTYGSSLVRRNPVEIEVSFAVAKFIEQELMLPFRIINTPNDSLNYELSDSLATLKFNIQEDKASQYSLDSFDIVLNYAQMNPSGNKILPTLLKKPQKLSANNIVLDTLQYTYKDN